MNIRLEYGCMGVCLALTLALFANSTYAQSANEAEEKAIRQLLARFYDGWNTHDVDKMVSVYADDIDHINVFAEWHKGKASIAEDLRLVHERRKTQPDGSIAPPGTKAFTIEKIRFIKPDVAVAQVRSVGYVSNLGTYM